MATTRSPNESGGEDVALGPGMPGQTFINFDILDVPDGRHLATVTRLTLDVGKSSGEPYLNAQFTLDGPEDCARHVIWTILSFHPRSLGWTRHRLETMAGHSLADRINLADPAFIGQFIGRRVLLRTGHQEGFGGRLEPEVLAILPPPQNESEAN